MCREVERSRERKGQREEGTEEDRRGRGGGKEAKRHRRGREGQRKAWGQS